MASSRAEALIEGECECECDGEHADGRRSGGGGTTARAGLVTAATTAVNDPSKKAADAER